MKKFALAAFAFIAAIALAGCQTQLDAKQSMAAEHGGLKYAQMADANFVSCSALDSDGDGYVTCSIKGRQASAPVTEILCAYNSEAAGCKQKR